MTVSTETSEAQMIKKNTPLNKKNKQNSNKKYKLEETREYSRKKISFSNQKSDLSDTSKKGPNLQR